MTANGVGGYPLQNCSFIDSELTPKTWIGFVAQELQVKSLTNVASASHGNQLIASSIIEVLTRFEYDPKETLILFNITYPGRFDAPCEFGHPEQSNMVAWDNSIIPYTYLTNLSNAHQTINKISPSQVNVWLVSLFNFLENQKFDYRFLLAENFLEDPVIGKTIKQFGNKLVHLDQSIGIKEFTFAHAMLKDIVHPTVDGHKKIATCVMNSLR